MKTHWLYGFGPNKEVKLNVEIDEETKCSDCIHVQVCDFNMRWRCSNYTFGTSEYSLSSCQSCINRFTRFDKDKVPCFVCPFFVKRPDDFKLIEIKRD